MSFWNIIDHDRMLKIILTEVGWVIDGWLKGRPLDEVALMNRLTGMLARQRRGCDVGILMPVEVKCRVFHLHRQGTKQTDKYGSDLAVTIFTDEDILKKTVFFQLKKSTNLSTILDKQQVDDAMLDYMVADRAFVCTVDDTRYCVRLQSVKDIDRLFKVNQRQQTFDTYEWFSLSQFLSRWMECQLGPNSYPDDPNSIERLLEEFAIDNVTGTLWGSETGYDLPDDFLPAKAWLQAEVIKRL